MSTRPRFLVFCAAVLIIGTLVGGYFGDPALATPSRSAEKLRAFSSMLGLIQERYMDETDSDEVVYGAIRGMLRTLDPHSNFLDPNAFREMREEQRGSFSGLGIVISVRGEEGLLTVISPIEGTPAHRAGMRAGDIISMIDGEETAGMTIGQALKKLRGKKGTTVDLIITREAAEEPLDFTITRDDIPTTSIPYAYMLRPGVGYIKIKNFTQTTSDELDQKLRALSKQGMERLILDLRANPGGLLEQAVKVSSRFLGGGKLIVYTRGRVSNSDQEYYGSDDKIGLRYPLIVMVNKGSASASEIVAGAIQDHDRGLVVGENTWGKGLVQTVYPMSHESALALTTAKYYTPSGRLIQRDYRSLEDYFTYAQMQDDESREVHYTDAGREVLSGGGITPDVEVENPETPEFIQQLVRRSVFFDFAVNLLAHVELDRSFEIDEAILTRFKKFIEEKKIEFEEEDLKNNFPYLETAIRAEVLGNLYGLEERSRALAENDLQLLQALDLFPRAQAMLAALTRTGDLAEQSETPDRQSSSRNERGATPPLNQ
ncbi:MAG: S41 family peptidase [Acidobacteriota bacterium]